MKQKLNLFLLVTGFFAASIQTAFAYVDPATGSYVLQMVLAGLLGLFVAIRAFWANITSKLRSLTGRKKTELVDEDD